MAWRGLLARVDTVPFARRRERVGVVQRLACDGVTRRLVEQLCEARECAAADLPSVSSRYTRTTSHGASNASRAWFLDECRPQVRRDGVEATAVDDPGVVRDRRLVVPVDHLSHPVHLAGEITVVGAGRGTRRDHRRAVGGVRSDSRTHHRRLCSDLFEPVGVGRVADHERDLVPLAVAAGVFLGDRREPFLTPAAERERQIPRRVVGGQVFGDEPAGDAGRAPQE